MKIQRKPHIHMMDLYNEHYGYDVNTNAIFKISDELAKYLKAVLDSEECNYENLFKPRCSGWLRLSIITMTIATIK